MDRSNRFFGTHGDLSVQLAPWTAKALGFDPKISLFLLKEPLQFRSDIAGGIITVPAGFISDLASIPRAAWSLGYDPDCQVLELAAWVHDLCYGRVGKIEVDRKSTRLNSSHRCIS